ncbi:MAG: DUF2267 domain-containing protein [Alphaproteobacteria bacterium]|nr:MAG: DUF2267 domain-containing protein [Alphaproteobacteria bacterium]
MSALGLKIIDEAVQTANIWVNEVNERTGWEDKERAYRLLRAVLHAVRDNLTPDEAADLGDQLPTLIRGIYYEAWNPSKTPKRIRKKDAFIEEVQKAFRTDPLGDPEIAIGAVLDVLDAHVSPGEMADVRGAFTKDVRELFAY